MVIGATLNPEDMFPDDIDTANSNKLATLDPADVAAAAANTAEPLYVIMDGAPDGAYYTLDESLEKLDVVQIYEQDAAPLVLTQGVDLSLDHCPNCETLLDPVDGGYRLNVATGEAEVQCQDCDRRVVLKRAFSSRVEDSFKQK